MQVNMNQDNLILADAQSNLETVVATSRPEHTEDGPADNVKHVYVTGGWEDNADRLAEFFFTNLVNRNDAYGKYRPIPERDGRNTALTVREPVTLEVLQTHFRSRDHSALVGLHSSCPENRSRWMVIDIDHHGPPNTDAQALNESFAVAIFDYLVEAGMRPLMYASNGLGGYHVWLIFQEPVLSSDARRLGLAIAACCKNDGLPDVPEVFPKQDVVREGGLGNWVRLPGLHHTREFHTQVWDGQSWLEGQDAVDLICAYEPVATEVLTAHIADLPVIEQAAPLAVLSDSDDETRPIYKVLRKLKRVGREGIGYKACCPAHADSIPSLSIREDEDGKVLIHCFAGCEPEEVLAKIGLGMKDLFPPPGSANTSLKFRMVTPQIEDEKPVGRMADLQQEYNAVMEEQHYDYLKDRLGFAPDSVRSLGVGWCAEDRTWSFPEKNAEGRVVGIFKRSSSGKKKL